MSKNAIVALALLFATLFSQNSSGQQKSAQQPQANGFISGSVVDESGYPLDGAVVHVRPLNSTALGRTVFTDADGKFVAHGLDNAVYKIWATSPAYVMRQPVGGSTYHRVGDSVKLELVPGGVITGKVTTASGAPVIGIRVRALPFSRSNTTQFSESTLRPVERLTDDRGVYRIYGLFPGTYVVSAGGSGVQWSTLNPYDAHAPTFAPSSTIDAASEIIVATGQESNVDIRYRVDQGRIVTGVVRSVGVDGATVSLTPVNNNRLFAINNSYVNPDTNSFVFYGVPDGEYEVMGHSGIRAAATLGPDIEISDTKRISVKGNDVTGLELVLQPMGVISGQMYLDSSSLAECRGKRKPMLSETVVDLVRHHNRAGVEEVSLRGLQDAPALPDEKGIFVFRNVRPGEYAFRPQFFAQHWYLRSIILTPPHSKTTRDAARYWTALKSGDHITDLRISLAEGAASLRGQVIFAEGANLPDKVTVYLIPSKQEEREDGLRFFAAEAEPDGAFLVSNVAPGSYWVIAIPASDALLTPGNISLPSSSDLRKELRQAAAKVNFEVELKPCKESENIRVQLQAR